MTFSISCLSLYPEVHVSRAAKGDGFLPTESQRNMPIASSPGPERKPVKAKDVKRAKVTLKKKTPAGKVTTKKVAKKSPAAVKVESGPEKSPRPPRAKVINEHPGNPAADPPPGETPATSMVARVSDAIERELSKIERIVDSPVRIAPAQRIETESRARVLASLARTLKEVMRLREQERGAGDDTTKAADDDAIPRDLDEFRRELSRRLEGLVADAAPVSDRGNDEG